MGRPSRYSPEVRERAVRMVFDHQSEHDSQWSTIRMVADKIGCSSETLRNWVRQVERDQGLRLGASSEPESTVPRVSGSRDGAGMGGEAVG